MKTAVRLPDLSNATPGGIVDMCAPEIEEMNKLKKRTDYFKTGLKARLTDEYLTSKLGPVYTVYGEQYVATISTVESSRMDGDKVRAFIKDMLDKGFIKEYPDIHSIGSALRVEFAKLEK